MDNEERLRNAAKSYADARTDRDTAIRDAYANGLTLRKIAACVGLSHQRVHNIVSAPGKQS